MNSSCLAKNGGVCFKNIVVLSTMIVSG